MKIIKILFVIVLMLSSFFLGSAVSISKSFVENSHQSIFKQFVANKDIINEIQSLVETDFIGEVDTKQMFDQAVKGMVYGLNDPYTEYYNAVEAKAFWDDLNGNFEGIGVEISNSDGRALVVSVLDNSPAKKSGLLKGDVVLLVDEIDVEGMTIGEIATKIKGAAGTVVKLKVLRNEELLDFSIERAEVVAESVVIDIQDDVLILRFLRFDEDTDLELQNKIQGYDLSKIRGIIVDVRGNPGGYFDSAIKVSDLFLKEGLIVSERHKDQSKEDWKAKEGDVFENQKIVVLIDEYSASASEILAGAISDNDRGELVGKKTYGKGSVQTVEELSDGSILKITSGEWLTPKGLNLRKDGILPDVEVDLQDLKDDLQLKRGMELLLDKTI